ncbi:MerC domain-containing protein [Ningiella sp. W23]|uniref:MerC domain-containing protein n=1 Tax=Ningiella sp. W23 TaxID=3023715 RepID=UPI003756CA72
MIDIGDKTAIVLSFLCALHCIATPLLLLAIPAIAASITFDLEIIHLILLFFVIPISAVTIISGYRRHEKVKALIISFTGVLTLIAALIFGHDLFAGTGETILTLIGSGLVAFGHVLNLKLRIHNDRGISPQQS